MPSKEEMLGKVVAELVHNADDVLGVFYDITCKLQSDRRKVMEGRHEPLAGWTEKLKRFARMEPCWEQNFSLQGDQQAQFQWVARQVVLHPGGMLSNETLGELLKSAPCTPAFWRGNSLQLVPYFVGLLLGRGVIRVHEQGYKVILTRMEFEIIFHVRLSE